MDSTTAHNPENDGGLGEEVRESLVLLGVCMAVTAAVTVAAQATLTLLG
ncbi:MAG: hypothetical protein JJD92_15355 [Frankiaceae bacterium]|nr:hypothetical protein [Frankiaceae bacterium]